jgi:hypothetical protein
MRGGDVGDVRMPKWVIALAAGGLAIGALLLFLISEPAPVAPLPVPREDAQEIDPARALTEGRVQWNTGAGNTESASSEGPERVVCGSLIVARGDPLAGLGPFPRPRPAQGKAAAPPAKFSFDLVAVDDPSTSVHVAGQDGRFEFSLPRTGHYRIGNLRIDGEDFEDSSEYALDGADTMLVVIKGGRKASLFVVDARTGAPVPTAVAVEGGSGDIYGDVQWRSPSGTVVRSLPPAIGPWLGASLEAGDDGRIPLGRGAGQTLWFVRAPGHAWSVVQVNSAVGGEIRVPLAPGGKVLVRIPDGIETTGRHIALVGKRWSRGAVSFGYPGKDGSFLIEGLLPGKEIVELQAHRGPTYATGEVEVIVGTTVEITLCATKTKTVVAEGRITIPEAWGEWPRYLVLRQINQPAPGTRATQPGPTVETVLHVGLPEPAVGRTATFRSEPLAPGKYRVSAVTWKTEVEIRGGTILNFELPEPVEILIDVVDDETSEAIPEVELTWSSRESGHAAAYYGTSRRDALGPFRILVVPDDTNLRFHACASRYRPVTHSPFRAVAGSLIRHTIRMKRAAILRVRFEMDGRAFSADGLWLDVIRVGEKYGCGARSGPDGLLFDDLAPGTFRLVLKPVPNLRIEDPGEVVLRAGETTEVTIQVVGQSGVRTGTPR